MFYSIVKKRKHIGLIQAAAISVAFALTLGGHS